MFRKVIFFLFLFTSLSIFAQKNVGLIKDTVVNVNELTFNSLEEEELFSKIYDNKSNDYFSLLYLVKKDADVNKIAKAKVSLENQINIFKSKSKEEKKYIKWIYKDVHDRFFKKYELINHFDDVFEKGYYNCLSSTAIYSLILEELKIPYQINILPNHVNLTAYPLTHKIRIESTDPVKGYFTYDKKFKEQYIASLLAYKLIEKAEIETKSVDEVFDNYFNTEEIVGLKELVGAQYYNDGLYLYENENIEEAIQQLEKAVLLYPNKNTARLLFSLYLNQLVDSDYKDEKHIDYLIRASRFKEIKKDIEDDLIGEFGRIADKQLLSLKDTLLFNDLYKQLHTAMPNKVIKNKLELIYYGAFGEYYFNELEYETASKFLLRALNTSGDTLNLSDFYMRSIVLQITGLSDMEKGLSILINAEKNYNKLSENKIFMTTKAEVYSLLMMRSFERNKLDVGEKYMSELEKILDNVDIKKNETNIGVAFAQAGSAYFRLGNRSKAKMLFKKGLVYCPGHYELEYRLSLVNY